MAELERQRVATAQAAQPLAGSSPAASVIVATSFNGRTPGCYPVHAGSSPAVAAHAPIVQRSRMPVSHIGDAGSNPARGLFFRSLKSAASRPRLTLPSQLFLALGRVWRCGSAVSRVRRVRSPSRALFSPSLSGRAPRSYRGQRGFDSSRRDCVARLVASPRAVNPWSRVRFPGDA